MTDTDGEVFGVTLMCSYSLLAGVNLSPLNNKTMMHIICNVQLDLGVKTLTN